MKESDVKVYGYRWVVLAAFMFINLTIQILWICFAPVTGPAAEFFHVSDMQIGMLAMSFMIVYIPLAIPASWVIDRLGFKNGVGLGAVLLGAFGLLRGLYAPTYPWVLGFTLGIAVAQPLLLNAFTTLAAKWFPLNERASVSGLATVANFLGTAIGLMLTPYLVTRYGIPGMQLIYGVLAALSAAAFLILAREAAPTPMSPAGFQERALMFDGLKMILRQADFYQVMVIFFVGMGVFNGVATWIEAMVRPKGLSISQAGMLGGLLLIGGIIGAAIIPALSDHYRKRKPFILAGMICAVPGLWGFTFGQTYLSLLVSIFVLGFFMMGMGPIGLQYAAEITFPAPEGTSNGLLMLASQLAVVFIYGMEASNNLLGSFRPALLLGVGLMAMSCLLIARLQESSLIKK
jgi:MFS family permease